MKTYYFNLVRNITYNELVQLGVEAASPEAAEQLVDNFMQDEEAYPTKEFLITERNEIDKDYMSVLLIENTDPVESNNENEDVPEPERA